MSTFTPFKAGILGIFLVCCPGVVRPALTQSDAPPRKDLAVLAPKDGQRIGEGGDRLCPAKQTYCNSIRAEGRVPAGYTPFFAVEPVPVSPKTWIQPVIQSVRADGTFSGLVYLGEELNGAGEQFKIYLLACRDRNELHTGDVIFETPKGCLVSDPVEVIRTR